MTDTRNAITKRAQDEFAEFIREVQQDVERNRGFYLDKAQEIAPDGVEVTDVRLGGSYARGTPREDSDVDLELDYRGDIEPQALAEMMGGRIYGPGGAFDVHPRKVAMTKVAGGVRSYIEQMATMYPQREGWTHSSKEALLLAEGQQFIRRVPVKPYGGKMRYKACYENAYNLVSANSTDLVYCEGYAASIIAVPHAWAVERGSGSVVDPTWDFEGEAVDYFGIPLKLQFISRWLVQTGHWGLFGGDQPQVLDLLRDGLPGGAKEQV